MVKIIQWNVLFKEKVENIVGFLREINADVICLQELRVDDAKDVPKLIAKELGLNYHFVQAHKCGNIVQGNGIFSKHPIVERNHLFVQEPKGEDVKAWDEGRVIAEADIDINGKIVKIATVHLSYTHKFQETEQKLKESGELIDYVKEQSKNFIIAGDFNVSPKSQTIKEISKYLKHCGPASEEPTFTTKPFEYEGFKETELRWRLDYAFCTNDIEVRSSEIVKTDFSDHLPIIIDFD
jgi:endonuclease/exonuclease/phosphatase family metal-dependent hydrolase